MKKNYNVIVNQKWCKSCEICVAVCPKKVFDMDNFYAAANRPEDCIGCLLCEKLCPDFAIEVRLKTENEK